MNGNNKAEQGRAGVKEGGSRVVIPVQLIGDMKGMKVDV